MMREEEERKKEEGRREKGGWRRICREVARGVKLNSCVLCSGTEAFR